MITEQVTISEDREMDGRRLALLVQTAGTFRSKITLEKGGIRINAKSLMGTMAIGLSGGEQVAVFCEGEDEAQALASLREFLIA